MPPLAGPRCNMEEVEKVLASMEALVKKGKFAEVGGVHEAAPWNLACHHPSSVLPSCRNR